MLNVQSCNYESLPAPAMPELFREWDADGNGAIDKKELRVELRQANRSDNRSSSTGGGEAADGDEPSERVTPSWHIHDGMYAVMDRPHHQGEHHAPLHGSAHGLHVSTDAALAYLRSLGLSGRARNVNGSSSANGVRAAGSDPRPIADQPHTRTFATLASRLNTSGLLPIEVRVGSTPRSISP